MKLNFLLLLIASLSYSCSLESIPTVDVFSNTINEKIIRPKDSVEYNCEKKKTFFLFYLNEGKSVWLVLPDREFKLNQIEESQNIYSNDITTIEISSEKTQIRNDDDILYNQCIIKKS
jgi:membrane-bound inhibitor of C-type lysozyme